uniref:Uncharacterized protein n=1 Tax=Chromera velia CCMP2878 TaxID=1169474 RepID=A0A0G4H9U7_9ALVE|eukprot:Cvel_5986.t1-p1 / transcript=Cvel_5986.t1 / gene=Cvel_5986 / organism=Chromera_velia_CCMP2878 / gene_product=hypothetical protein / transcript_product=hypothetical protein / location=Cvel_scaffold286:99972-102125(-) / protein_length=718 / sequence_SO=supercontig / SO=protein_coding / is_pseudo=false
MRKWHVAFSAEQKDALSAGRGRGGLSRDRAGERKRREDRVEMSTQKSSSSSTVQTIRSSGTKGVTSEEVRERKQKVEKRAVYQSEASNPFAVRNRLAFRPAPRLSRGWEEDSADRRGVGVDMREHGDRERMQMAVRTCPSERESTERSSRETKIHTVYKREREEEFYLPPPSLLGLSEATAAATAAANALRRRTKTSVVMQKREGGKVDRPHQSAKSKHLQDDDDKLQQRRDEEEEGGERGSEDDHLHSSVVNRADSFVSAASAFGARSPVSRVDSQTVSPLRFASPLSVDRLSVGGSPPPPPSFSVAFGQALSLDSVASCTDKEAVRASAYSSASIPVDVTTSRGALPALPRENRDEGAASADHVLHQPSEIDQMGRHPPLRLRPFETASASSHNIQRPPAVLPPSPPSPLSLSPSSSAASQPPDKQGSAFQETSRHSPLIPPSPVQEIAAEAEMPRGSLLRHSAWRANVTRDNDTERRVKRGVGDPPVRPYRRLAADGGRSRTNDSKKERRMHSLRRDMDREIGERDKDTVETPTSYRHPCGPNLSPAERPDPDPEALPSPRRRSEERSTRRSEQTPPLRLSLLRRSPCRRHSGQLKRCARGRVGRTHDAEGSSSQALSRGASGQRTSAGTRGSSESHLQLSVPGSNLPASSRRVREGDGTSQGDRRVNGGAAHSSSRLYPEGAHLTLVRPDDDIILEGRDDGIESGRESAEGSLH